MNKEKLKDKIIKSQMRVMDITIPGILLIMVLSIIYKIIMMLYPELHYYLGVQ